MRAQQRPQITEFELTEIGSKNAAHASPRAVSGSSLQPRT